MARLSCTDIDSLAEAFESVRNIPPEVNRDMLESMGKAVESCIKESAGTHGVPMGPMVESVYSKDPVVTGLGGHVVTTFKGGRHRYNTYTREAEIAFITNYGKRGEPARPFITDVQEKEDPRIAQAGEAILNTWLDKSGL